MPELDLDLEHDNAIAMYIAIAPRDPRDASAAQESDYLPPVTLEELAEQLIALGIPSQVMNGADLGAPGWVIAKTLGVRDGRAIRWAPHENTSDGEYPTIGFEDVAATLAQRLNSSCHIADHPTLPATHVSVEDVVVDLNARAASLVGAYRSTDAPLLAHAAHDDIWFAFGQPWSVVGFNGPDANVENLVTWATREPSVLLERHGPWRTLTVSFDGNIEVVHEWGPTWYTVDPRDEKTQEMSKLVSLGEPDAAEFVLSRIERPHADSTMFAGLFNLDDVEADRLDLVLAAGDMDDPFTSVCRILGLPEAAAELAEGWRDASELPGAISAEFESLPRAAWSSVTTVPLEKDVTSYLTRLWIERPTAYYVMNAAEFGVWARNRGYRKTAALSAGIAALTVADFFVPRRWRGLGPRG